MGRYLMTHSLLASWLYTMKENPYEDILFYFQFCFKISNSAMDIQN